MSEGEKKAVVEEPQLPEKRKPHKPRLSVGAPSGGLVPRTFDEMYRMAGILAASGMTPKDMNRPEQVFAAVQMGAEIGLSPMQAVQNIAVINGRPSVWGDAMLAIVQGSGLLVDFDETPEVEDGKVAGYTCTATRRGRSTPIKRTFTMSDAKAAGLAGKPGPWQSYPARMLQMRARSWALRDGFADVLKGVMAREEAQDIIQSEATVIEDTPFRPGRHEVRPKALTESASDESQTDPKGGIAETEPENKSDASPGPVETADADGDTPDADAQDDNGECAEGRPVPLDMQIEKLQDLARELGKRNWQDWITDRLGDAIALEIDPATWPADVIERAHAIAAAPQTEPDFDDIPDL